MKKILLSIFLSLFQEAYSQEEAKDAPAPESSKASEEEVDPAHAIKNNFAIGPYDREGKFDPTANRPDEKFQKQAMEETPELMEEPKEDN